MSKYIDPKYIDSVTETLSSASKQVKDFVGSSIQTFNNEYAVKTTVAHPSQAYNNLSFLDKINVFIKSVLFPWSKENTDYSNRFTRILSNAFYGTLVITGIIAVREFIIKSQEKSVTGGASGIGRLMAEKLALREKARVVIWDINQEMLDSTVRHITLLGGFCQAYKVDVTNREQVYATAKKVEEEVGNVDILINNAGIVAGKSILLSDDKSMERVMHVNAISHFWTTKAFIPYMVQQNSGHIVTVASAASLGGTKCMSDYCASKFAAFGFAESVRVELKDMAPHVKTTIVCPFYINTGMFDGVKTRWPRILPILEPNYVAEKIIKGMKRNEELMILPRFGYITFFTRFFMPVNVQDQLLEWLGITDSMDHFQGRR